MVAISVQNLSKSFGAYKVFDGIDLEIPSGAYTCLLGPSGCGKSTLMRIIAGLDGGNSGRILFDGADVGPLTCAQRDVGMAFQNYALYPHLTVEGNLLFPLRSPIQKGRWTEAEMRGRVDQIAELLQIKPYLHRTIDQLSGGQQQRVSLGRALVRHPKALLLDEPVTHLDARLRYSMRSELKRIHELMGTTTIHVTHDQQEALAMADLLVILRNGRIEQAAPAMEVYRDPATRFVAGFLGNPPRTLLDVGLEERDGTVLAHFAGSELVLTDAQRHAAMRARSRSITLALDFSASSEATDASAPQVWQGIVRAHERVDEIQRVVVDVSGQRVNLEIDAARHVAIGDPIGVRMETADARLFDGQTGLRLRA